MVGDVISVEVTVDGVPYTDSTDPVVTEIGMTAEQTGMAKAEVTFDQPVSVLDEIDVLKGSTEQEFTVALAEDGLSAELTFKNNLSNGAYTVILTPYDDNVEPSSTTLDAISATKATRIGVTSNYLVMKDTDFQEGYCFITGFNDFDEQIALSGLNVNAAPADSTSYDSSTGKVTVKYAAPGYAVVKNVAVFAQYTGADEEILTCQETLEVTSIGYPAEIEFGEVKKDGTMRDDGLITIAELGSNKYYVEIESVKDQYGYELSADDLNKLVVDKKLVTVIPTNDSPVFFGTNTTPFTTVGGKIAVFLTAGKTQMPGTGSLMITGAGGTFSKEIEISDDPYIEKLTVDIPDVYQGEWTDAFSFSAVDQYGDDIDLYDFVPDAAANVLTFTDTNHLTSQHTKIQASDSLGVWEVKKDTIAKTFKVRFLPGANAKSMISFTTISAGMDTVVQNVTVGEIGGAAQIVAQTSGESVTDGDKVNLNSKVSFKDANGKVMVRTDCYDAYPIYLNVAPSTIKTDSSIKNDTITAYYWVVTPDRIDEDAAVGTLSPVYDADGVIVAKAGKAANDATALYVSEQTGMSTPSYYVTLLGKVGATVNYKVLDSKTFRFNYSPVNATADVKYSINAISASTLLYATSNSDHSVTIGVTAKNTAGETWKPDQSKISLAADNGFTTDGAKVLGKHATISGTGSVNVKVYYNGNNGMEALGAVSIPYSDAAPVASGKKVQLTTTTRMGENFTADTALTDFKTSSAVAANVTMADGTFQVTNVNEFRDTLKAWIVDQYGRAMSSSKVELDGDHMAAGTIADTLEHNFVITNGSQKIDLILTNGGGNITTNASTTTQSAYNLKMTTASTLKSMTANGTVVFTIQDADGVAYAIPATGKVIVTYPDGTAYTATVANVVAAAQDVMGIAPAAAGTITMAGSATATHNTWPKGTYSVKYTDPVIGSLTGSFEVAASTANATTTAAKLAITAGSIAVDTVAGTTSVTIADETGDMGTYTLYDAAGTALASGGFDGTNDNTIVLQSKSGAWTASKADTGAATGTGKFKADGYYVTFAPSADHYAVTTAVKGATLAAEVATYTQVGTALGTADDTSVSTGAATFTKAGATTGARPNDGTAATTPLVVLDQFGKTMTAVPGAALAISVASGANVGATGTFTWTAVGVPTLAYGAAAGNAGTDTVTVLGCTITITVT